jgi:triosephosphate isomerase (TIM)
MLIAGNWKMYKWPSETAAFCRGLTTPEGVDIVVCPPFTSIDEAVPTGLTVYAQNVHWEAEGAFTGEISAEMLLDAGVRGTLVGHSERRQHFCETDETAWRRAAHALDAGLGVIFCVGESEDEREAGRTEEVLRRQLDRVEARDGLVLAYEPVWAIGTGKTATPEMAEDAHAFIKGLVDVRVLYGGSVKPDNAEALLSQPDVDGALVGGASLELDSFNAICETAARIRS